MMTTDKFLPGTGRWRAAGVTEEPQLSNTALSEVWDPTTASRSPSPFRGGFVPPVSGVSDV